MVKSYAPNKVKVHAFIVAKWSLGPTPPWLSTKAIKHCSPHSINNNSSKYLSNAQKPSYIPINWSKGTVLTTSPKTSSTNRWITTMCLKISGWTKMPDKRPWTEFLRNPALLKNNSLKPKLSSIHWLVSSKEWNGPMMRMLSENREGITSPILKKRISMKEWERQRKVILMIECSKTKKSRNFVKICSERKEQFLRNWPRKRPRSKRDQSLATWFLKRRKQAQSQHNKRPDWVDNQS